MGAEYRVKLLKLMSGERFPLLLGGDGQPLFEATAYALTELRARNQAINTNSSNLRAIQVFYLFLDARGIDLSTRLSSGQLFSLGEVEDYTVLSVAYGTVTRQALYKHERIRHAFDIRKKELLGNGGEVRKVESPQLQIALDRIARLEAENRRIESENNQLLEQFARWAYNAHTRGLDHVFLNRALPSVNRGQTKW